MNPAYKLIRDAERQNFLKKMRWGVLKLEKDCGEDTFYNLARLCLNWLRNQRIKGTNNLVDGFFFTSLLPRTNEFSRALEEQKVMITEILGWLVQSIASRFREKLSHEEKTDPQTIFRIDSVTSRV